MINMKGVVWLLVSISVLSCTSRDQQQRHITRIESHINIDESGNEIFDSFYTFFVGDSIFQKHRTIIPESVISSEYSDQEGIIRDTVLTVDAENWKYISITSLSEIEIEGDTAYIVGELLINGNLHLFENQFYILNGKWYLDLTTNQNEELLNEFIRSLQN